MRPGTHRAALYRPVVAAAAASTWWTAGGASGCLAAWQPKGAASQAASYSNLANPGTYDAGLGDAPTWNASTGWTFNGSSNYLTTGVTCSINCTLIVRFANASGTSSYSAIGARGTQRCLIQPRYLNTNYLFAHNTQYPVGVPQSAGVLAMTATNGYLNGSSVQASMSALGADQPAAYLGAHNYNGTATALFIGDILAAAIYDNSLSDAQIAALSAALAAL